MFEPTRMPTLGAFSTLVPELDGVESLRLWLLLHTEKWRLLYTDKFLARLAARCLPDPDEFMLEGCEALESF